MIPIVFTFIYLDDSASESEDNGGGDIVSEDDPPVQAPFTANKGIIIELETTPHGDNHELVGTDKTIPSFDYASQQSDLVVKQSHPSIRQSDIHDTKHHLLTNNGSSIMLSANGVMVCIYR